MTSWRNWLLLAVCGLVWQGVFAQTVTPKTVPSDNGYSEEDFERSLAETPNDTGVGPRFQTSPTAIVAKAKKIPPLQACDAVERGLYATATKFEAERDEARQRAGALEFQNVLHPPTDHLDIKLAIIAYICTGIGLVAGTVIVWAIAKFWRRLVPKSARAKQALFLIPAACWSSFCTLGIANDPDLMRHPINAAVTALLWSSPALMLGGIGFWWFSQQRKQASSAAGNREQAN